MLSALLVLAAAGARAEGGPEPVRWAVVGDIQSWTADTFPPSGKAEFPAGTGSFASLLATHEALCSRKGWLGGVIFVGDMVDDGTRAEQWLRVDQALDILDACGLPYFMAPGNHDPDIHPVNARPPLRKEDWVSYNAAFAARPFQPGHVLPGPLGPSVVDALAPAWRIVLTPLLGMNRRQQEWSDGILPERQGVLVQHHCIDKEQVRSPCSRYLDERPGIRVAISGHWCCGVVRRWWGRHRLPGGREVVAIFSNDQHNTTLHGWTTLLELRDDSVTVEAWHPVRDQRGYGRIGSSADRFNSRFPSPERQVFQLR